MVGNIPYNITSPILFRLLAWRPAPARIVLMIQKEVADRILLVHMLEWSEKPLDLLHELWRVLAPNGRLLLVVPNRRGLWARVDIKPFKATLGSL